MRISIITFILLLVLVQPLYTATRYVDNTEGHGATWSGVNGESYNPNDAPMPEGYGYTTLQAAIDAMTTYGDTIYLRGGTHTGYTALPYQAAFHGTGWEEGNYTYIGSYPGEWAILDGQGTVPADNKGVVLGYWSTDKTIAQKYWMFERLEITGAGGNHDAATGLRVNSGPFKVRYCYIHDNYRRDGGSSDPFVNGGIGGVTWQDSVIEYCRFNNNAVAASSSGDIHIASDYNFADIRANGFDPEDSSGYHLMRNIVRYNYFPSTTAFGYLTKSGQYFSGKTSGTQQETYNAYGSSIHHNILTNPTCGIQICEDFCQIYNNIIDGADYGINLGNETDYTIYRAVTYNNTIIDPESYGIYRLNKEYVASQISYYGYDYNNIVDAHGNDGDGTTEDITLREGVVWSQGTPNYTPYVGDRNYFYRPADGTVEDIFRISGVNYTAAEFTSTYTGTSNWYKASSEGTDNLYSGDSGANQYITRGTHEMAESITITGNGIDGNHPYLSGVTIPSYVGAVNPSDSDWVSGVLGLDATYFTSATAGSDPTWIEGSGSSPAVSGNGVGGNGVSSSGGG